MSDQRSESLSAQAVGRGRLLQGDCLQVLPLLPASSIDSVITDPPYNFEFIGREWDHDEIQRRKERVAAAPSKTLVKNVPYGSGMSGGVRNARWYARNRQSAIDYQAWVTSWAAELFRVCKPGSYVAVFSAPRFIARVQVGLEDAGFFPRDVIVMVKNAGIPKGYNLAVAVREDNAQLADKWAGYHSALRSQWEGVVLVQKPLVDNYLTTALKHQVGLMKTQSQERSGFLGNVHIKIPERSKASSSVHATPKPLEWLSFLVELLMPPNKEAMVLDPFIGTGTTAVAAELLGYQWIGIDLVEEYLDYAATRVAGLIS